LNFIIAQILGLVTTAIGIISIHFKDINHILISHVLTNVIAVVTFALLDGMSGAWVCFVAAFLTVLMYFVNKSKHAGERKLRIIIAIVFVIVTITGTVIVFKDWKDLFSGACAVLYAIASVQENSEKFRRVILFNQLSWIVYNFSVGAYTNLIMSVTSIVSTIIAMIRYRAMVKDRAQNENNSGQIA
jgi:hypothetical protein